jgi:glutamyl-tRNA reductase
MSKIIIIGASGIIGSTVADLLEQTNQVIRVGNRQGDYTVDLSSKSSIEDLFEHIGPIDAVICATQNILLEETERSLQGSQHHPALIDVGAISGFTKNVSATIYSTANTFKKVVKHTT